MNISSLISFFQKKPTQLTSLDTILIKKLKNLSYESNLLVFKDVKIYHHTSVYTINLIVLDSLRGLYLFESKEWTYDELKNADIQKAQNQENSNDTLAYENTQSIIKNKFNELTHNDGVPIFNYLMMENLNADEYEHLNDSFKSLLPQEKIIFSDSNQADILKKLHNSCEERNDLQSIDNIMGTLFIQYSILDTKGDIHLCTDEQRAFIDTPLQPITHLTGQHGSGKSNLLLLKAIVELLNKSSKRVLILKPTALACDIFKKKLLNIIEHAIIEIDLTSIEIITPVELLNKHILKLGKKLVSHIEIDSKLMKKSYNVADTIMCDDSDQLPNEFILYLNFLQKKSTLLLVSTLHDNANLSKNFRNINKKINFYKLHPHAKALQLISKYMAKKAKNILLVSNSMSREKLKEDLSSFIVGSPEVINSSEALINQNFNNLLFCNYSDINELNANHVILMDLCFTSENEIEYAFNLAQTSVDILYEEECDEITQLRNRYEQGPKE
ncbi:hypothetical protein JHD46_02590 [Sulfurimonas sp. SAG-AH-194-C20]|nr:hypothetical protein [Sulfurimonas sp. SAG-AH-194-C20]MDF1878524.1 hypothetical protein [Sulfurimonas sp. SAG-AH-194-C20]